MLRVAEGRVVLNEAEVLVNIRKEEGEWYLDGVDGFG